MVVCGLLNKQIGFELDISEITVKAHRGSLMRKMKANSLAHLVSLAARLGIMNQPNVNAYASTPGSRNSISNVRSAMGADCLTS